MPKTNTETRRDFVSAVLAQLGKPYAYGATGPDSFDCSGLVLFAAQQVGINGLPRTAKAQASNCAAATRADLKEGDLIFFDFNTPPQTVTHVGVYIGNGKMVNAQSQSPAAVAQASIDSGYWSQRILGYGRLLPADSEVVASRELVASANTVTDVQVTKTKPKHVLM